MAGFIPAMTVEDAARSQAGAALIHPQAAMI